MPSYKTLVQILIATSVASSAVAAPVITFPEEGGSHTGKSSEPSTSAAPPENPATHEPSTDPSTHSPQSAALSTPPPAYNGPQLPASHQYPPQTFPSSGSGPKFTFKHVAGAFGGGAVAGAATGGLTAAAILKLKNDAKNAQANNQNSTAKRFVEDRGHISRSLANLSDEHLRFLRDISHWARALEGLD